MGNKRRISIVVVTYNSEKYISECLSSILKAKSSADEIIVIDNNSKDGTLKKINLFGNKIRLVKQSKNMGFASAVNLGMKLSESKFVLLVNPDSIMFENSIGTLLACLENEGADIAGGLNLKNDNTTHGTFVRVPTILTLIFDYTNLRKLVPGDVFHKRHYYLDVNFPKNNKVVDVVSGSFMLIKRELIKEVGIFDERFFMYLEDVDFCTRAKKKGFKVMFCPHAKIIHSGGGSSKNRHRINYSAWNKSRVNYSKKYFPHLYFFLKPLFFFDELISQGFRNNDK